MGTVAPESVSNEASPAVVGFANNGAYEFSPSRGETYSVPVQLQANVASVSLSVYTSDGELVKTVTRTDGLEIGLNQLVWDGKDDSGTVVPDEAYIPVLTVETESGEKQIIDPRTYSGGELVEKVPVEITPDQEIAYSLPASCRVLIRAGIKGGAMLRNLSSWQAKGAGKNVQHWDGKDQNGLIDIRKEPNLGVLVIAFKLPENAILTYGNQELDYRAYRLAKHWEDKVLAPEKMQTSRNGTAISPHYYAPRAFDAVPDVSLTLQETLKKTPDGVAQIKLNSPVAVKADIAPQDRWMMKQSLYEVAFFVDHEFVAEEEQGYVPLTWQWLPQQITPGRHLLTVNISGFSGKVGVASVLFDIVR
ncbi:FlgD immunoglobulin-like domain containing protein [Methylomonas methanica]|uniref:FlgD immunoglobulin-like domain containing protein n=1 Tax=Methylomonas methanica TaxID=421 RepID=UPI0013052E40|nr:FlgD immunoglobulin-like domain containing protein [Methylomonas methanica]